MKEHQCERCGGTGRHEPGRYAGKEESGDPCASCGGAGRLSGNLYEFCRHLRNAFAEPTSERFVRGVVEEAAKACPLDVLLRLGECLVACHLAESRREQG